jgi:hypothetical protein
LFYAIDSPATCCRLAGDDVRQARGADDKALALASSQAGEWRHAVIMLASGIMSRVVVNVDNFARAETDRMFAAIQGQAGGVNQWLHYRVPTPLDQQPVIRMNRDTLYSAAVVDISAGATITIPDAGRRYFSVMIVNQDHYNNKVLHEPGKYELTCLSENAANRYWHMMPCSSSAASHSM